MIGEHHRCSPTFPHETTAEQFVNQGQFEEDQFETCGRSASISPSAPSKRLRVGRITYASFADGLAAFRERQHGWREPEAIASVL